MHDTPLISLIAIGLGLALVEGLIAVRVGLSVLVHARCVRQSLGLMADDAYALMLAGALLSFVVNPLVFRLANKPVPHTASAWR